MPGEHGAEGGEGEEEQTGAAVSQKPHGQTGQGVGPHVGGQQGQLHQHPAQGHRRHGQQQEGQPGQILGDEQGLPAHGQGVHHAGGAVIIKVAEAGHGAQQPHQGGQPDAGGQILGDGLGQVQQQVLGRAGPAGPAEIVEIAVHQIQRNGKHPKQAVQSPEGPEAGHGLAIEGPVKARYPGPHSPHLPIHR